MSAQIALAKKVASICLAVLKQKCPYQEEQVKTESYLPGFNSKTASISHGGDHTRGKRKIRRPLDPKQALHVVLRSSLARGEHSMLHPKHCGHIHHLVKVPSRAVWRRFLRELAGGIAMIVTGARKGASLKKNKTGRGFWDHLAFTRIVHFGRDFERMGRYLIKNLFEAAGVPMKKLLAQGYRICTISKDGVLSVVPAARSSPAMMAIFT